MGRSKAMRIRLPRKIKKGDVIEVKVKFLHPMESGMRKDKKTGKIVPKDVIQTVEVYYGDSRLCWFETGAGMSKNPLIAFKMLADTEAPIKVIGTDHRGRQIQAIRRIAF